MRLKQESKEIFKKLLTPEEFASAENIIKLQTDVTIADERPILVAMRNSRAPLCMPLFHSFDKNQTTTLPCVWVVTPQSHLTHLCQLLIQIELTVQASRLKITPMLNVLGMDDEGAPSKIPGWLNLRLQFGADYRGGDFCHPDPDDMHYLALLWSTISARLAGSIPLTGP